MSSRNDFRSALEGMLGDIAKALGIHGTPSDPLGDPASILERVTMENAMEYACAGGSCGESCKLEPGFQLLGGLENQDFRDELRAIGIYFQDIPQPEKIFVDGDEVVMPLPFYREVQLLREAVGRRKGIDAMAPDLVDQFNAFNILHISGDLTGLLSMPETYRRRFNDSRAEGMRRTFGGILRQIDCQTFDNKYKDGVTSLVSELSGILEAMGEDTPGVWLAEVVGCMPNFKTRTVSLLVNEVVDKMKDENRECERRLILLRRASELLQGDMDRILECLPQKLREEPELPEIRFPLRELGRVMGVAKSVIDLRLDPDGIYELVADSMTLDLVKRLCGNDEMGVTELTRRLFEARGAQHIVAQIEDMVPSPLSDSLLDAVRQAFDALKHGKKARSKKTGKKTPGKKAIHRRAPRSK